MRPTPPMEYYKTNAHPDMDSISRIEYAQHLIDWAEQLITDNKNGRFYVQVKYIRQWIAAYDAFYKKVQDESEGAIPLPELLWDKLNTADFKIRNIYNEKVYKNPIGGFWYLKPDSKNKLGAAVDYFFKKTLNEMFDGQRFIPKVSSPADIWRMLGGPRQDKKIAMENLNALLEYLQERGIVSGYDHRKMIDGVSDTENYFDKYHNLME